MECSVYSRSIIVPLTYRYEKVHTAFILHIIKKCTVLYIHDLIGVHRQEIKVNCVRNAIGRCHGSGEYNLADRLLVQVVLSTRSDEINVDGNVRECKGNYT